MAHAIVGTKYRSAENWHSIIEVIETTGENAMDENGKATYKFIQHPKESLVGKVQTLPLQRFNSVWLSHTTHNTAKGTQREFVTDAQRLERLAKMQNLENEKWASMTQIEREKEEARLKAQMAQEALIAAGESAI